MCTGLACISNDAGEEGETATYEARREVDLARGPLLRPPGAMGGSPPHTHSGVEGD